MGRSYAARVFSIIKRFTMPILIFGALVAALVASNKYGYDDIETLPKSSQINAELETQVFSIRRAPELLTSPLEIEKLSTNLGSLMSSVPSNSCLVVAVGGETVFSERGNIPLYPGTNVKVITGAAALMQLGPEFTYQTILAAEREPNEDGSLLSTDLYVFGGGDPLLMTDSYIELLPESYSQIRTSADELADLTVGMNILFIQGAVRVDESRYDESRTVDSWSEELQGQVVIGSLSASLLDQGYDGLKNNYSSQRGTEDPPPLDPSRDPAIRFAASFDDLLEARNVIILEAAREFSGIALEDLVQLLSIDSPPMSEIIKQMLVNDDTMTAEMIVKEIGYSRSGEGKSSSGTTGITEIIRGAGLPETGLLVVDGSGINTGNQVTCKIMQEIADYEPVKPFLQDAFPVAGEEGVIAQEFRNSIFAGNLNVKTSRSTTVGALLGYFTTDSGDQMTISFMVNHQEGGSWVETELDTFYENLGSYLRSYSSGLPIEMLEPK